MLEKRLLSLLGVALQDQTLLDQLQVESENMVGERSCLAWLHMDSINSLDLRGPMLRGLGLRLRREHEGYRSCSSKRFGACISN